MRPKTSDKLYVNIKYIYCIFIVFIIKRILSFTSLRTGKIKFGVKTVNRALLENLPQVSKAYKKN